MATTVTATEATATEMEGRLATGPGHDESGLGGDAMCHFDADGA